MRTWICPAGHSLVYTQAACERNMTPSPATSLRSRHRVKRSADQLLASDRPPWPALTGRHIAQLAESITPSGHMPTPDNRLFLYRSGTTNKMFVKQNETPWDLLTTGRHRFYLLLLLSARIDCPLQHRFGDRATKIEQITLYMKGKSLTKSLKYGFVNNALHNFHASRKLHIRQ